MVPDFAHVGFTAEIPLPNQGFSARSLAGVFASCSDQPDGVRELGRHIVLTWMAPDDGQVTGYRILRRRPALGEDVLLEYVANTQSPAATYTDTNVTAGVQHAYRVKAINAAGASPVSNYVNVIP